MTKPLWPAEIKKWDHLHGLSYSVAVGSEAERKVALMQRASVYIINRENVQWLIEENAYNHSKGPHAGGHSDSGGQK